MQAYDSVKVKADVELGGTDQRFNVLAGRTLQKAYNQIPQNIISSPLIEGLDGRKMSSSWGNTINLMDSADEMFGKLMSLKDESIIKYFTLLTRVSLDKIKKYEEEMAAGGNPKDYKMKLANEIIKFYHNEDAAKMAEENFTTQFQKKGVPDNIKEINVELGINIIELLKDLEFIHSNNEGRRKINEKAVKLDDKIILDFNHEIKEVGEKILKLGKKMVKLIIK